MKIALFAAVAEEVGCLIEHVNLTGIGRENATKAMVRFMREHKDEDFTILNIGTVGAHERPVGSILSINEIISAGEPFNQDRMLLDHLDIVEGEPIASVLYSSDCFVSPAVFTQGYLDSIKGKADCFDMESSALYAVAHEFGKKYVSFKIVSDHLDVTIDEWRARVEHLSKDLSAYIQQVIIKLSEKEPIEFLMLAE